MIDHSSDGARTIDEVKAAHEDRLMSIDGVQGVGIGQHPKRDGLAIKVYVDNKTQSLQEQIPKEIEGFPVEIEVSGEFNALPA